MKKLFIFVIVSVIATSLSAQDLIVTTFGDTIPCKIIRMDSISVVYQTIKSDGTKQSGALMRQFVRDFKMEQKEVPTPIEIEETASVPEVVSFRTNSSVATPKPAMISTRFAVSCGYAKRLSKLPTLKRDNADYVNLFKKLTNSFSWESELLFYGAKSKGNGFGLKASGIHASVSEEKVNIKIPAGDFYGYKLGQNMFYVGPAWSKLFETDHFLFSSSLSLGAIIISEKQWPYGPQSTENKKIRTVAGGINYGIGSEVKVSPGCAIGIKLGVTLDSGKLFNLSDPNFKSEIPVNWSAFVVAAYVSFR
jgi:hypothetical protein